MFLPKIFISCGVIIAVVNSAILFQDDLTVGTKNGLVRGLEGTTIEQKRPYYSFRGIPFAETPVGALRFEPPMPVKNWIGVLDALGDKPPCIQGSDPVVGVEDCLHINVYTPTRPSASCELLPTLVWIYGGGFEAGDASYDNLGPDHLLDQDVVVVTFQYRLGLLGFLSTGDSVAPGNNGLKDQVLALKWVKDNIQSFCGNPNEVTLGGQSAGSASVAYHLQSPLSQGLFHRAILSSGTSISLWALSRRIPAITTAVAKDLGLDISSSQSILNGLKDVEVTQLQTQASSTSTSSYLLNSPMREGLALGPVAEPDLPGAFFTGNSHQILEKGQFTKVPILLGFNSMEAFYEFDSLFRLLFVQYDVYPQKLIPADLALPSSQASTAGKEIKSHYFAWLPIALSDTELLKFLSHDQFVRSIREFARLVNKQAPVYLYRFSYEGGLAGIYNRTKPGVAHSEELFYYWVSKHEPLRPHDLVVKSRVTALWSNFIKHANPTPNSDSTLQNISWSTLGNQLNYLDIGENLIVTQNPESGDMKYWDSFFEKYGTPSGTY